MIHLFFSNLLAFKAKIRNNPDVDISYVSEYITFRFFRHQCLDFIMFELLCPFYRFVSAKTIGAQPRAYLKLCSTI